MKKILKDIKAFLQEVVDTPWRVFVVMLVIAAICGWMACEINLSLEANDPGWGTGMGGPLIGLFCALVAIVLGTMTPLAVLVKIIGVIWPRKKEKEETEWPSLLSEKLSPLLIGGETFLFVVKSDEIPPLRSGWRILYIFLLWIILLLLANSIFVAYIWVYLTPLFVVSKKSQSISRFLWFHGMEEKGSYKW